MKFSEPALVAALTQRPEAAKSIARTFLPEWLRSPIYRPILEAIYAFLEEHKTPPSIAALREILKKRDEAAYDAKLGQVLDEVEQVDMPSQLLAVQQASEYATVRSFQELVDDPDMLLAQKDGDAGEIVRRIRDWLEPQEWDRGIATLVATLRDQARRQHLIESAMPPTLYYGWLQVGEAHILAARSTAGKTSLMLWHAAMWALGIQPQVCLDTLGSTSPWPCAVPRDGWALLLLPEVTDEDFGRVMARLRARGAHLLGGRSPEIGGGRLYVVTRKLKHFDLFDRIKLAQPDGWERLAELAERTREANGPGLIVLDTLARLAGKYNELDNSQLTELIERCERLALRTNSAVVVTNHVAQMDHTKKWDDIDPFTFARGGTGQVCAARVGLALAHVPGTGGRVVGCKMRANNLPGERTLYWITHHGGDEGINFFEPADDDRVQELQRENEKRAPSKADFLQLLRGAGGEMTSTAAREAYAELWSKTARTQSNLAAFKRVRAELLDDGLIELLKGPGNTQRIRLAELEAKEAA